MDRRSKCEHLRGAIGILAQIGDTGTAYFTGAIAIHSFNTLVLRNKLPVWICLAVNVFGWLLAVLFGEFLYATKPECYSRCVESRNANLGQSYIRSSVWNRRPFVWNLSQLPAFEHIA